MVKAGDSVDAVIDSLLPHLDEGDLVADLGNSFFRDSERREKMLAGKGDTLRRSRSLGRRRRCKARTFHHARR